MKTGSKATTTMSNTTNVTTKAELSKLPDHTLTQRIKDKCETIDTEQAFRDALDEIYSFKSLGGPFEHMQPSKVLEEMEPTTFRCGHNDWVDGERQWVEFDGETYEQEKLEEVKADLISELENERDSEDDEEEKAALQSLIDELEAHSF